MLPGRSQVRIFVRALRRYWWNEDRPANTETTFTLALVLAVVLTAGWLVSNLISGRFASAATVLAVEPVRAGR